MLTLIRAGLYTSVQDAGRFGMRQSGVSYCGALDSLRWRLLTCWWATLAARRHSKLRLASV